MIYLYFKRFNLVLCWLFSFQIVYSCISNNDVKETTKQIGMSVDTLQKATFGGGCFWCTEAVFQRIEGVDTVISGYCGGYITNPTYKQICTGTTGHAEVIQVLYDSSIVSYGQLLKVFFETHDPTTLNRQGNDMGTQYRSVIFPQDSFQKDIAIQVILDLNVSEVYPSTVVTSVEKLDVFYPAEEYHQNYYQQNKEQGYCRYVIQPKIEKFDTLFKDLKRRHTK